MMNPGGGGGSAADLIALARAVSDPTVLEQRLEQLSVAETKNAETLAEATDALTALAQQREELESLRSAVADREADVAEREEAVQAAEEAQIAEAQTLKQRNDALDNEVRTRHAVCKKREDDVRDRENAVEAREAEAEKKLAEAKQLVDEINARDAAVRAALKPQEPAHI